MSGGRHRQLGPLQRLLAVAGAVVLVLAVLVAGKALVEYRPTHAQMHKPYLRTGKTNDVVDVRTFDVTVLGTRYGSKLRISGAVYETSGVWVIVKVRLAAHTEPMSVGYMALHDRSGRSFEATERFTQNLAGGGRELQPGIPVQGEVAFEVPKDALAGMTIRFSEAKYDQRMDAMADIALPNSDNPTIEASPSPPAKPEVKP